MDEEPVRRHASRGGLRCRPPTDMIEAIKLWNEPNNLSHWDFTLDPQWREFSEMTRQAATAIRQRCPGLPLVLGGISPIDASFVSLLNSHGLLEHLDAGAVHGLPLD